jgi:hypothetical protein
MPHASHFNSAIVLDGLVYIVGAGDDGCGVLRFDPASGAWSTLAPTLHDRSSGASFVVSGCLYAAGGREQAAKQACVERYDVASNTWAAVADMLQGRTYFRAVAVTIGSAGSAEEQDLFDSLIAKASGRP